MRIGRRCLLALAPTLLLGTALFSPSPALAADCPNEAIRKAQTSETLPQGTVDLPACMALEMVSPPKKFSQGILDPRFSDDGSRILFRSLAALAGTPGQQANFGDRYVATRDSDRWVTAATSPPASAGIDYGGEFGGGPFAFSSDLGRWVSFGASSTDTFAGNLQLFTAGLEEPFEPLSPLLRPIDDSATTTIVFIAANVKSAGASADLSLAAFPTNLPTTSYLPGDPRSSGPEPGGETSIYLAHRDSDGNPAIELLAREEDGTVHGGRCGTHLGGGAGEDNILDQGAISPDGSRIYFTTRPAQPFDELTGQGPQCDLANPLRVMVRSATPDGPEIEPLIEGDDPTEPGDDLYQAASVDGTKVYFTTTRALAASDKDSGATCSADPGASAGCDLYLYDSTFPEGSRLIQVSAGEPGSPTPGEGAEVLSPITAISADGSRAYFVAEGVLTTEANPEGDTAQAGEPNLYLHADEELTFLGTLADADRAGFGTVEGLWGNQIAFRNSAAAVPYLGDAGGDGHILVFATAAPLGANDTDGDVDVYRYDSEAQTLQLITVAAPGGSGAPAADAVVNRDTFLTSRWVSDDGEAITLATAEPLLPGDEDAESDPYLWRAGELLRLPPNEAGDPPVTDAAGAQVAFSTSERLLVFDGDTAEDVYLARVDGGFPEPAPPQTCDPLGEGACQAATPSAPQVPAAASAAFWGPGNRKARPACRKPKVRRKGRCVKPKRKPSKRGARNRAHDGRGGDR